MSTPSALDKFKLFYEPLQSERKSFLHPPVSRSFNLCVALEEYLEGHFYFLKTWLKASPLARLAITPAFYGAVLILALSFRSPAAALPLPPAPIDTIKMRPPIAQVDYKPLEKLEPVHVSRTGVIPNCGDNQWANYIYMHESGCNTGATNWIGCTGIGQSCPASKISHCGLDYDCQNAWFTAYANAAYGGWYGAYLFWTAHHWW